MVDELGFQMHYVVMYDPDLDRFFLDPETTDAKFPDGQVWTGVDWYKPREGDDPQMHERLYHLEDRLAKLLYEIQED